MPSSRHSTALARARPWWRWFEWLRAAFLLSEQSPQRPQQQSQFHQM
jgi:hypothetical protein